MVCFEQAQSLGRFLGYDCTLALLLPGKKSEKNKNITESFPGSFSTWSLICRASINVAPVLTICTVPSACISVSGASKLSQIAPLASSFCLQVGTSYEQMLLTEAGKTYLLGINTNNPQTLYRDDLEAKRIFFTQWLSFIAVHSSNVEAAFRLFIL